MNEKVGRNDPCPCGSGKKYKNCCLEKSQKTSFTLSGRRKFKATVLSSGNMPKQQEAPQEQKQPVVDYNALMERSFGSSLHSYTEKPPVPENPMQYLSEEESK